MKEIRSDNLWELIPCKCVFITPFGDMGLITKGVTGYIPFHSTDTRFMLEFNTEAGVTPSILKIMCFASLNGWSFLNCSVGVNCD